MSKSNKSIEELQDLINYNKFKINDNKNKIHILNSISTENRLGRIAILSEFAYLPICILTVLYELVAFKYMPITILGASLIVGLICNMVTEKSFKIKRRVARISSAKNESEREEEIFKYEIENEKLNSKNKALSLSIQTIQNEEDMIYKITKLGKYIVTCKDASCDRTNNDLERELGYKSRKLDELSTKKYLSSIKISDWMDIAMNSMMVGVCIGITMIIPLFGKIVNPVPSSPVFQLISTLGTMGAAMGISIGVLNSKRKRQKNILKKYMKENENIDVDNELITTINEVSKIKVKLLENKRKEELDKDNDLGTGSDLVQTYSKENDELESVCGLVAVFSNDEIEGKTLVKRNKHKK